MKRPLTKDFAEKLCSDVRWERSEKTGKLTCRYKSDDLCLHQNHFICELVLFKQRSEAKEARGGVPAISPSRIGILDSCFRKYAFIYVHRLPKPVAEPLYFKEGTAFSNARAKMDSGIVWNIDEVPADNLPPVSYRKLRASLRFYKENPPYKPGSAVCELETTFEHDGHHYLGYLDARSTDLKTIYEWKYAVQPYDRLKAIRQAAVYFYRFDDAEEFQLITFAKPQHKPKKAKKPTKREPDPQPETMAEFEERVYQDLTEKGPEKVYQRVVVPRDDLTIIEVLDQMNAKFDMVETAAKADYPPSYGACRECDYRRTCDQFMGKSTSQIVDIVKRGGRQ